MHTDIKYNYAIAFFAPYFYFQQIKVIDKLCYI